MKRLLVLLMVLGLAASAQAQLSLSVNGSEAPDEITLSVSDTIMIDVTSGDLTQWSGYLELVDWGNWDPVPGWQAPLQGEWVGGMNIYAAAGELAVARANEQGYTGTWFLNAGGLTIAAGKQFDIEYHCKDATDVSITLYASDWSTVIDRMKIVQPEPMTIALLGLGGLFLRRRR